MRKKCRIDACEALALSKGLCNKHYLRSRTPRRRTTEERYEAKVDRSGGVAACHPWTAAINEHGYGIFTHDGESLAARWGYKHFIGLLDADEVVRHTCDVRACQNRNHWVKGSQVQNIMDAVERSRQHRPLGERNVKAKLRGADVLEIRASSLPNCALADRYGVSRATINAIRLRRTWRHI